MITHTTSRHVGGLATARKRRIENSKNNIDYVHVRYAFFLSYYVSAMSSYVGKASCIAFGKVKLYPISKSLEDEYQQCLAWHLQLFLYTDSIVH